MNSLLPELPDKEKKKFLKLWTSFVRDNPQLRCQFPMEGGCKKKVINSHSIQKSGPLKLLADDTNHVIMMKLSLNDKLIPVAQPKLVGINMATIFNGLCDKHDNELFSSIEKKSFDPHRKYYLFLLCYRAILRDHYAKLISSIRVRKIIQQRLREPELSAFSRASMSMAFDAYKEGRGDITNAKKEFDNAYLKNTWNTTFKLWLRVIDYPATIAVASCFTPDFDFDGSRINTFKFGAFPNFLSVIVYPLEKQTLIGTCVSAYQYQHLKSIYTKLESANEHELQLLISELALRYCENIVISPKNWGKIEPSNRRVITRYFNESILDPEMPFPGSSANLFSER